MTIPYWTLAVGVASLLLIFAAVYFYSKRAEGKGQYSAAAISAIGAIWASYATLIGLSWQTVFIALVLREAPGKAVEPAQPSLILSLVGGMVAMTLSYMIYRLASKQIEGGFLPTNASAHEAEEPGRRVGVMELAGAHIRYRLSGKPDNKLSNPGETPYRLPEIARQVEWTSLAADLIVQAYPVLQRDKFSYVGDRRFFSLESSRVGGAASPQIWVVYACSHLEDISQALPMFDLLPTTNRGNVSTTYAICTDEAESINITLETVERKTVTVISKGFLISKTLDLYQYAESLLRRFEERVIPGSEFTLAECFVAPRVREVMPDAAKDFLQGDLTKGLDEDLLTILEMWSSSTAVDHLSVVGEFGQGKSTALLAFCAKWARKWIEGSKSDYIPLLIELRGKSPRRQAPDRFLAEWGDRFGLRGDALFSLVQAGKAILIFEGFDEVQDAGLRFDRFEQFKALWSFSYPGTKIVFTGRPNFFLDTDERERLLRNSLSARDAGLSNSRVLSLSFLDETAIEKVLIKYPIYIREEIVDQCKKDPAFFEIAKRPSMLPVLGNQWLNIRDQVRGRDGITSAAIIGHFIDFLYARKEADVDKLGDYQILQRDVRHFFTQCVVWQMVKSNLRNTIDYNHFVLAIEEGFKFMDAQFRGEPNENSEIATGIRALKEKFRGRPQADLIASIATDVRTNGLLAPDPAGGRDNLYFPHKQYYEFVFAQIVVDNFYKKGRTGWASSLSRSEIIDRIDFEPVALYFASGLVELDTIYSAFRPKLTTRISHLIVSLAAAATAGARHLCARLDLIKNPSIIGAEKFCPIRYRYLAIGRTPRSYIGAAASMILGIAALFPLSLLFKISSLNEYSTVKFLDTTIIPMTVLATISNVAALAVMSARPGLRLEGCLLLMEIYRRGSIPHVQNAYGSKAHAALILIIFANMPNGSVSPDLSVVRSALTLLNLDAEQLSQFALSGKP